MKEATKQTQQAVVDHVEVCFWSTQSFAVANFATNRCYCCCCSSALLSSLLLRKRVSPPGKLIRGLDGDGDVEGGAALRSLIVLRLTTLTGRADTQKVEPQLKAYTRTSNAGQSSVAWLWFWYHRNCQCHHPLVAEFVKGISSQLVHCLP